MRKKTRFSSFLQTAFLMAMILTLVCSAVPVNAAAKKKVKLSSTKITLETGKSKTIRITGASKKASWKVSDKSLVSIKTGGSKKYKCVIRAKKKTGTCYVTAKVGKKTLKCKVTVKKKQTAAPEETYVDLPISESSVNQTAGYTAGTVTKREADTPFISAVTGASLELLQKTLETETPGKNVLVSPDSVFTALAMTANGAAGSTLSEMEAVLGGIDIETYDQYLAALNDRLKNSTSIKYHIADSIWYCAGSLTPKAEFLQKNVDYYGAEIYSAPFTQETVNDINNWVSNHTKGMIPGIIDELSEDDRMALINAIAFEGKWEEPYQGDMIDPQGTFTDAAGEVRTVTMLNGTESTWFKVGDGEGFIKPYAGGDLSFMALLPPEGMSAEEYAAGLTGADFAEGYSSRLRSDEEHEVIVSTRTPEFSYDYDINLNSVLQNMGMQEAFTGNADFSGLAEERVEIDRVIHKTHIELDRNGTKAAAVTAVIAKESSFLPAQEKIKKKVYLDRPFVYAIIDDLTGIPLFIGIVNHI